jgi:transposase InsO family protein/transposase-like protein
MNITENEWKELLDRYFRSPNMTIKEACNLNNPAIPHATMYGRISRDSRYAKKLTFSKRTKYSNQQRLNAVLYFADGHTYRETREKYDIANDTAITYWYNMYKQYGKGYFMAKRKSFKKPDISKNFSSDDKDEIIKQLEFELACARKEAEHAKKCEDLAKSGGCVMTNKCKRSLITLLSQTKNYPITKLCEYFNIPRPTYYYKEESDNKYQEHDQRVLKLFGDEPELTGKVGYRKVCDKLEVMGYPIHERRTREVLLENGLQMVQRKTMKKHSSYKNDGNPPVKNWLYDRETKRHFFKPENVWEILSTDVTEFHVNGFKVFLSPVIDLKDSSPIVWRISDSPDKELMMGMLDDLTKLAPEEARFLLHSDQGSVYRSPDWKNACKKHHILQSMSRKGKSGDNAGVEGFFGRLKQEWFNKINFKGYTYGQFVKELNEYLVWYNEKRLQRGLGKKSPLQYRENLQLEKAA